MARQHPTRRTAALAATALAVTLALAGGAGAVAVKGKLVFQSYRDGSAELYTVAADGTGLRRLTRNGALDGSPSWSPTGDRILFESDRNRMDYGDLDVYTVRADGTRVTQLTFSNAFDGDPAWSPTDGRIAFESERDAQTEIYSIEADGSGERRLTSSPALDALPSWSPDGRTMCSGARPDPTTSAGSRVTTPSVRGPATTCSRAGSGSTSSTAAQALIGWSEEPAPTACSEAPGTTRSSVGTRASTSSRAAPAGTPSPPTAWTGSPPTASGSSARSRGRVAGGALRSRAPRLLLQILELQSAVVSGQYVAYTFYRLDPAWRRLPIEERSAGKDAFAEVVEDWSGRLETLRTYSVAGVRPDCDFFLWKITERYDDLGELGAALNGTPLAGWLETPYSYLATTKASQYTQARRARKLVPRGSPYLVVYPFVKTRPWYALPEDDRQRAMDEHIRIGAGFATIHNHTTYSFGIDDQEFMTAFECDEPADFMHLMLTLRDSEASRYTERDTPIFVGRSTEIRAALDSLDGAGAKIQA